MHYYKFNIGDYSSHTQHLDIIEDLAYRRMLDYCFLNEEGLPKSIDDIARFIRMRTHNDCIANVLREFFYLENGRYYNKRVEVELFEFKGKSEKAAQSAKARWAKHKDISDANAVRTQSEGNAKHKPLNKKQEPLNNNHIDDDDISIDWLYLETKTQTFTMTEQLVSKISGSLMIDRAELIAFLVELFEAESIKPESAKIGDDKAIQWITTCCRKHFK